MHVEDLLRMQLATATFEQGKSFLRVMRFRRIRGGGLRRKQAAWVQDGRYCVWRGLLSGWVVSVEGG